MGDAAVETVKEQIGVREKSAEFFALVEVPSGGYGRDFVGGAPDDTAALGVHAPGKAGAGMLCVAGRGHDAGGELEFAFSLGIE